MVGFRVQASEDIFEHVITPLIANRIYKLPAVIQEKSTLHENLGGLEVIIQNEIWLNLLLLLTASVKSYDSLARNIGLWNGGLNSGRLNNSLCSSTSVTPLLVQVDPPTSTSPTAIEVIGQSLPFIFYALHSTNGTQVDGTKVKQQKVELKHGDEIHIVFRKSGTENSEYFGFADLSRTEKLDSWLLSQFSFSIHITQTPERLG